MIVVEELSVGQRKFLAEFLGNFALAWIVGAVVSPFFSGDLSAAKSGSNLIIGLINVIWPLGLSLALTKEIKS